MARITVEDCIDKVGNRFELVLFTAHRARILSKGAAPALESDRDKNPVIALREVAEGVVSGGDLREDLIHALQRNVEVDEPERGAAPTVTVQQPMLGRDDRSRDTVVDTMSEEALLKAMQALLPEEASSASARSDRD